MGELSFSNQFSNTAVWYHGTTSTQVPSLKDGIDVYHSKRNCDFGIGFYVTSKFDQAVKWAQRKTKDELPFNPNVKPVVLSYQFQDSNDVETKIFEIDKEYCELTKRKLMQISNNEEELYFAIQ